MTRPVPDAGPAPVDATAILVNHNSGARLAGLADAVLLEVPSMVVVDNASEDGSLELVEGREEIAVMRNGSNLGFAAAVNRGSKIATGEWLLLVNPDIHLQRGDIHRLLQGLGSDVAAVAPLQVDENGRARGETGGYEATLGRYLVWALVPARFHGRFGPWLARPFPERDVDLDWVSGALLGVRRSVFEQLGRFDERYFLYHEDVDFGRRARAAGYRVVCRPSVRLHHEVAHGDRSRRILYTQRAIRSLALDPHFSGWRLRALGLVLGLGYGLRAILGSGTTRMAARAALPDCGTMIAGRVPAHR